MSFPEEDYERARDMEEMYLREKEYDMYVEWQMWEEEQERLNRLPAEIRMNTPLPEREEQIQSDEDYINGVPL